MAVNKMNKLLLLAAISFAGAASSAPMVGLLEFPFTNTLKPELMFFDSASPFPVVPPAQKIILEGLSNGETLIGIDMRPLTGQLYGITNFGRVAKINLTTGFVTIISATQTTLVGTAFDIDFNPVTDTISLISDANINLRFSPDTGNLISTDTVLSPAGSKVGAAYDSNTPSANGTTLFVIDSIAGILGRQGGVNGTPSPSGGMITEIGPLGISINKNVGFDISSSGLAVASLQLSQAPATGVYTINLANGAATILGSFSPARQVKDIAFISAFPSAVDVLAVPTLSNTSIICLALLVVAAAFTQRR